MEINQNALKIINIIEKYGFEARIAGGAVRDFLLNKNPKDWDIATTATPDMVKTIFLGLYKTFDIGIDHGTISVVIDGESFEVTTLRIDKETDGRHAVVEFTDDWKKDASRRDFTINSMFMDKNGTVYDYFDGKNDLIEKKIVFVGVPENRINEDHLRILRAIRFAAKLNFSISSDILTILKYNSHKIVNVSKERVISEIEKIISTGNKRVFDYMDVINLSLEIFGDDLVVDFYIDGLSWETNLFSMGVGSDWFEEYKAPSKIIKYIKKLENYNTQYIENNKVSLYYDSYVYGLNFMRTYLTLAKNYDMVTYNKLKWLPAFVPEFPVSGYDLLDRYKGEELGEKLTFLKKQWASQSYRPNKYKLLEML